MLCFSAFCKSALESAFIYCRVFLCPSRSFIHSFLPPFLFLPHIRFRVSPTLLLFALELFLSDSFVLIGCIWSVGNVRAVWIDPIGVCCTRSFIQFSSESMVQIATKAIKNVDKCWISR
jgi:hypothetical protein